MDCNFGRLGGLNVFPRTQVLARAACHLRSLNHGYITFQQHLIDYGIYPNKYEDPDGQALPPPENLEEMGFERFERADAHASKESQVVIPIIEGEVRDSKSVAGQVPFTNLENLTDGSLVPSNPDRYYSARPKQLDQQVRVQLGSYIVPSTQHDLPIAPNFFLTAKGPDGPPAVAERQACHDGALGARGINSLQTYGNPELDSDNKAYMLTSIYLLLQASLEMPCEYVITQIKAYALTSDVDTFRTGVSAYRNARDWAKQKRNKAIKRANETAARNKYNTSPSK
ncbi:hypothetical protein F4824DRAFT_493341 [Ustulina deusta]|nr:hypothetical protein F4824DRAFT_493341 [Ustulina deusta]